jgi:hypothetical protein
MQILQVARTVWFMVRPTGKGSNMVEQSYNYLLFVAMIFSNMAEVMF